MPAPKPRPPVTGPQGRPAARPTLPADLILTLDRAWPGSLSRQLADQLRGAVRGGLLEPGQRLPSTRALAASLGVGRNVVFEAFEHLLAEGYLSGRDRSGTFVAPDLPDGTQAAQAARPAPATGARWLQRPVPEPLIEAPSPAGTLEFRVGQTDTAALEGSGWRRVWREAALTALPGDYGDPAGDPALREAVAAYLKRARGFACRADDVIITGGAVQGVNLIAQATLQPGDHVAFEEPGYRLARQIFQEAGARIVPLPVDDDGLSLEPLLTARPAHAPILLYTTPSHQFPLGVRLSVARRLALLDWAQTHDALILEDDYDSEFRYGASPLPSLASLDTGGNVVYLGTFSKVLAPSVRVGYVVAPRPLRERLLRIKSKADFHTSWPVQRALALMITDGHLERHIRRMRKTYAARRAALSEALHTADGHARLMGLEAGLHAHLELAPHLNAARVTGLARAQGVTVPSLSPYYLNAPDRNGLLLGYGGLSLPDLRRGAAVLVRAIEQASRE
ncbi:PLP-dependent aminotransferase family protein [Deinococcus aquaticus]|uniref:PLP-dependent aminotransferase family protein n=1 Tax=Deinococcus aquaticus TaxID=328692 RepID=A0ABY7V5M9_9DEIO|nr:PLP-dependent aminotransferase family protein [Deinococcus aquaticus]WDA60492.1 PLP-dependent aminotransferase family protein [Deinococcus aquaticus]